MAIDNQKRDFVVKEFVGTYELSEKLRPKIIWRATRQFEKRGLLPPEELPIDDQYKHLSAVYGYIDHLVQRSQFPYKRLSALRLDSGFYDVIGVEDSNLSKLFEDEKPTGISLGEIVAVLKGSIESPYLNLLYKVLSNQYDNGDIPLNVAPDRIKVDKQILHRLEELVQKYGRNGSLIIPPRPIVDIRFNPLYIKFERKNYNKNPIAVFRGNSEYQKIRTRKELKKFDGGIHWALHNYHQIDEALPIARTYPRPPLSQEEKDEIIAFHPIYGGNSRETARHSTRSQQTILRIWKAAGLKAQGEKGSPLAQSIINKIQPTYIKRGRIISAVARDLGISAKTVRKYLRLIPTETSPKKYVTSPLSPP